jgi:hypothetical protein
MNWLLVLASVKMKLINLLDVFLDNFPFLCAASNLGGIGFGRSFLVQKMFKKMSEISFEVLGIVRIRLKLSKLIV